VDVAEWDEISHPIVEFVWECEQRDSPMIEAAAVAEAVGISPERAESAILRLIESGHLAGNWNLGGFGGSGALVAPRVGSLGMQAIKEWPSGEVVSELIEALRRRADSESDPATKSKLMDVAERLTNIGSSVIGSVLAEYLKRMSGL
jgi:hypothetical protein